MKNRGVLSFIVTWIFLLSPFQTAQSALPTAREAQLKVVPDLDRRLARFRHVQMPFDAAGLAPRERKMIERLVDACRYLDSIYWRQVDPQGLELYQSLEGKTDQQ